MERALKKLDEPVTFRWISDAVEGLRELIDYAGDERDIIFMDIKMPKMTGLEILADLDARGKLAKLRKINVLSSSALTKDMQATLSYDNVAYFTKPEGYTALCQLLSTFLDQPNQEAA